jgi:hypothetical protein
MWEYEEQINDHFLKNLLDFYSSFSYIVHLNYSDKSNL